MGQVPCLGIPRRQVPNLSLHWMLSLSFLFCLFALSACQRLLFTARICMRRHGFGIGIRSLNYVAVQWEPVITPCRTFQHERVGPACQKRTVQKQLTKDGRTSLRPAASQYSTTPRNGNPVNGNHLEICLSSPQKNGN